MTTMFFFLNIQIDFDQSHMFFPKIMFGVLLLLGALIIVIYGIPLIKKVVSGQKKLSFFIKNFDKKRLFGTFALIFLYFFLLEPVGQIIPNSGFGFWATSVIFILCMSLLYMHKYTTKKIIIVLLNALIAPTICWYILGYVFNLTLP